MQRQGVRREANALASVAVAQRCVGNGFAACMVPVVVPPLERETEPINTVADLPRQSLCFDGSIIGGPAKGSAKIKQRNAEITTKSRSSSTGLATALRLVNYDHLSSTNTSPFSLDSLFNWFGIASNTWRDRDMCWAA